MRITTTLTPSSLAMALAFANSRHASGRLASSSPINRKIEEEPCPPPEGGCGPGLWDEKSCQCLCVEHYCADSTDGTCSTVSSIKNGYVQCVILSSSSV